MKKGKRRIAAEQRLEDIDEILGGPNAMTCTTCTHVKKPDAFSMMHESSDPSPQVCDHCRQFGPPMRDPTAVLTPRELRAMEVLVAGGTIRDASRISGVDYADLSKMTRGKVMPHFRAAMQAILYHNGLTIDRLSRVLADTLTAEIPRWNPDQKDWNYFPDHSNRRATARDLLKMLGGDEPKEQSIKPGDNGGLVVNIMTNVGSRQVEDEIPGTIVARARRIDPLEISEMSADADSD